VEETLERFRPVQRAEDPPLLVFRRFDVYALDMELDPCLLIGLLNVHVLDARRARIRVAQNSEDLAQLQCFMTCEPAGRELAIEVPDRETPVNRVELRMSVWLLQPEWVEVRDEVTAHAVHVDELLDRDDFVQRLHRLGRRAMIG
jgi:hypothetical protein